MIFRLTGYDLAHEKVLEAVNKKFEGLNKQAVKAVSNVEKAVKKYKERGESEQKNVDEALSAAAEALRILQDECTAIRHPIGKYFLSDRDLDECTLGCLRYLAIRAGFRLSGMETILFTHMCFNGGL